MGWFSKSSDSGTPDSNDKSRDRYGEQRQRNEKAERAYRDKYGKGGDVIRKGHTDDSKGRSEDDYMDDWDSGNPTEGIGWD